MAWPNSPAPVVGAGAVAPPNRPGFVAAGALAPKIPGALGADGWAPKSPEAGGLAAATGCVAPPKSEFPVLIVGWVKRPGRPWG